MTYFSLFSLPRHLGIDLAALERSFYSQSRRLHPDRFASRPLDEQKAALAHASDLNDAYRTLRDPITRTEYLLSLEGIQLEEQSRQATDAARVQGQEKKQIAPPDLLEEAFELNMQLEEMRFSKASGEKDEQVERDLLAARVRFTSMLDDLGRKLEDLWRKWDTAEDAGNDAEKSATRESMVSLLNRRSYVRNLVRDVNAALE